MKSIAIALLLGASSAWAFDVDYGPTQAGTTLSAACIKTPASDASTFAAGCDGPSVTMKSSTLTVGGNAFSVGGSTLVVSNGMVGIGTTAPDSILHISGPGGTARTTMRYGNSGYSASPAAPGTFSDGDKVVYYDDTVGKTSIGVGTGYDMILQSVGFATAGFRFYTLATTGAGTERLRIDSGGNVGIGTTSPATLLDAGAGQVSLFVRTKAQLNVLAPGEVGAIVLVSDGVIPYSVCVGTGPAAADWKVSHSATVGCGTDN